MSVEKLSSGRLVRILLGCCLALGLSFQTLAAIDTYEFKDQQTRQRFDQLNNELRCPKCQNQNLADSNSPISMDLRAQVYELLVEGKSNEEIKSYLVARYGEYILYRPELSSHTLMLWLAPGLMLLLGLVVVWVLVRRRKAVTSSPTLDAAEQQRLNYLLEEHKTEPKRHD